MENDFVTDLTLDKNKTPNDLRELLLTLPVFEVHPDTRREFVKRSGTINNNTLFVQGDGAQGSLTLTKLDDESMYELIIEEVESEVLWIYKMRRSNDIGYGYDGWNIISSTTKTNSANKSE